MLETCRHRFTPRCIAIKQYRFSTVKHQTIDKKQLATNSPMRRSIFHFEKKKNTGRARRERKTIEA